MKIKFNKKLGLHILYIAILSLVLTLSSFIYIDTKVSFVFLTKIWTRPVILLMNFLPIFLFMLILFFLLNSIGLSFLLTGTSIFIMGEANKNMLTFRSENVRITYLKLLKEALDMVKKGITMPKGNIYYFYIILIIIISIIIFKYMKYKVNRRGRITGFILSTSIFIILLNTLFINKNIYSKHSLGIYNEYSETRISQDRGLVYPFLYYYNDFLFKKPKDYDESKVIKKLSSYQEEKPKEKVNIFLILGESFADLEKMGAKVSPETYASFRKLEENSITGSILNNTYGGGTIKAERYNYLGGKTEPLYNKNINTFIWMLKKEGYHTKSMHPFYGFYYNRKGANKYLGFDEFLYLDNYFDKYYKAKDGSYFPDKLLFKHILKDYEQRDKTKYYFNSVITMQNHIPYSKTKEQDELLDKKSFKGSKEDYNEANNYLAGIKNTGDELLNFIEKLENDPSPVVVIFYGDHLANLGRSGSSYKDMGVDITLDNKEGWLRHYQTPYIIWGNKEAKAKLNMDFKGHNEVFSNYYLFSYALNKVGFKTPYIKYLNERREKYPVDSFRYIKDNKKLTGYPSKEALEDRKLLTMIEYYNLRYFKYSNLVKK